MCDGKGVDFTQKLAKCSFHAMRKLKSVDFMFKIVHFMLMRDGKDVDFT